MQQKGTDGYSRIAVKCGAFSYPVSTRLKERILLGVQTKTGGQPGTTGVLCAIASGTSAFVAVSKMAGRAIVPCADDAFFTHDNAANATLHAVAPLCRERGKTHEILVPARPQTFFIGQVQGIQSLVQVIEGG